MTMTIKYSKENFIDKDGKIFLDNYDIIKKLGKGGYGNVYEVKNKKTGNIYACKHLSKLCIQNIEKFEREINILIKADHPNIIRLYEVYQSKHSLYLILQECKGGEVIERIYKKLENKENMYSEKDAAEIFLQAMLGVEYCHNLGICHRDLKLENLLLLSGGSEKNNPIKIIDFGLSQIFSNKKLTTKVGTPYYVAPEVLEGNYTEKCDIWSMGVILYILLCGIPPFTGKNEQEIYNKIQKIEYNKSNLKNVSNKAKNLIENMLTPENNRFNAKEVLSHPWLTNYNNVPISSLNFDTEFFVDYIMGNPIKKMSVLYIASRFDENEINYLKKIFEALDKDKNGYITFNELKLGLEKLKSNELSDQSIIKLFKMIDADKNGKINYTEFIAATIQKNQYLRLENLMDAFSVFDKDNSGYITKEDIMNVLNIDKKKEKEIIKYIQHVDKDGDGAVNYTEFLKLMGYENDINF